MIVIIIKVIVIIVIIIIMTLIIITVIIYLYYTATYKYTILKTYIGLHLTPINPNIQIIQYIQKTYTSACIYMCIHTSTR